jgi:predicted metal-dependent hydrolase
LPAGANNLDGRRQLLGETSEASAGLPAGANDPDDRRQPLGEILEASAAYQRNPAPYEAVIVGAKDESQSSAVGIRS